MEGQRRLPWQRRRRTIHAGHWRGWPRQVDQAPYLPCWRRRRVGYGISVFLVGLAFVVSFLVVQVQFPFSMPGVLLLGAIVAIALLWGMGPAAFARVSVRDEGPGIPLAEQGSIWEPFYRVQSTRAHSEEAVGLGWGCIFAERSSNDITARSGF